MSTSINEHLIKRIRQFDGDYSYLAELLLKEIEKDKKNETQLQEILLREITNIIAEQEGE